ncbi:hypothetical protein Tco_0616023, partial [Tanacetum coccineum]
RWSDSGSWWSTTVDRRRPPLTGGSGGGFVNGVGTDGRPRGTTQVVTRGKLMIELQVRGTVAGLGTRLQVLVRGGGSVVGSEGSESGSSCVRGRIFQANHWHLMRRLALLKDQNTLVSWALIGWRSEWTKIPLRGLGFKLRRSSSFWDSLGVG